MDESPAYRLEHLVAEIGWLRKLARSLVADASSADDVAQDALVPAASRPIRRIVRCGRGWLASHATSLGCGGELWRGGRRARHAARRTTRRLGRTSWWSASREPGATVVKIAVRASTISG
jgi:DNA-directed RNA polymerase specialized sigma24 family protein